MEKVSTWFLKFAVILLAIPVLLLCIFFVPDIGYPKENTVPEFLVQYIRYMIPVLLYTSVIPYYYALVQAFKLLRFIDQKQAFSDLSVQGLKKIKFSAVTICGLHTFVLPLFYVFAELDDAPGVIFVGLFVPFAAIVIAVFAAVLQKLLNEAIEIKEENELTV